jgi:hypothetical protein
MHDKLSRRDVLERTAAASALAVLGSAVSLACGKTKAPALTCTDTTALSTGDAQMRTLLAYVDTSTEPGKLCSSCQQFVPAPAPGTCGGCKILKGPINPGGNCKSFLAKTS